MNDKTIEVILISSTIFVIAYVLTIVLGGI